MSIYSTITLTPSEAIKLIAEHICSDANEPGDLNLLDSNDLLERILFRLTDGNKHSPYHRNNFHVHHDMARSDLDKWKDELYIS